MKQTQLCSICGGAREVELTDREYLSANSTILKNCAKCEGMIKQAWSQMIDRQTDTHFTFEQFKVSKETKAKVDMCIKFADQQETEPCGLQLFSIEPGVGKTHLGVATVRRWLLKHELPVSWPILPWENQAWCITSDSQILQAVRKTYNDAAVEDEDEVIRRFEQYPILMIDDLGKYTPKDTGFAQRVLFEIINSRCTRKKATIFTTNKSGAELQEYLGAYTFDRIWGMCKGIIIEMPGTSYRRMK